MPTQRDDYVLATNSSDVFMAFPQPQRDALFLSRPQRFLAKMSLREGTDELVYCANSGAMTGCLTSGMAALIWDSADPKRKRRYTWRAVEFEGGWIGTDTHLANRIVEEAIRLKLVPGLEAYCTVAREQLLEEGFRVDFVLTGPQGDCLVEVKSATIVDGGVARYPDSATPRGVKHLKALKSQALAGKRSVLLFLIQRADAHTFVVSNSHDPTYATAFEEAVASGVEVIALAVAVSPAGFGMPKTLPYGHESMAAMNTNN
jgi:sugar fermentation stimulation protein A